MRDFKNYKLNTLLNMALVKERSVKGLEEKLEDYRAKLNAIKEAIRDKQEQEGLSDGDLERLRKEAEEESEDEGVCPLD